MGETPIMGYLYSRFADRKMGSLMPNDWPGPRLTGDPWDIAANPPPIRATIFLLSNREYGSLISSTF